MKLAWTCSPAQIVPQAKALNALKAPNANTDSFPFPPLPSPPSPPRTKERASVEGVLSGLRATTSKATERLVQDSCIKAVEQREQVLLELHGKEMSDLKAELHKEHKEHERVKREHADLHREHTVLQEEMKDMINTNEENERKHHHLETNATNAVHAKTMGKASKHWNTETPTTIVQLLQPI